MTYGMCCLVNDVRSLEQSRCLPTCLKKEGDFIIKALSSTVFAEYQMLNNVQIPRRSVQPLWQVIFILLFFQRSNLICRFYLLYAKRQTVVNLFN